MGIYLKLAAPEQTDLCTLQTYAHVQQCFVQLTGHTCDIVRNPEGSVPCGGCLTVILYVPCEVLQHELCLLLRCSLHQYALLRFLCHCYELFYAQF